MFDKPFDVNDYRGRLDQECRWAGDCPEAQLQLLEYPVAAPQPEAVHPEVQRTVLNKLKAGIF